MLQPSTNIVDAVSGAETCPLCFDHYSAIDECSCVVCGVGSCPSCAETLDADGAARCFACRPVPVRAAKGADAPLHLPRPIAWSPATVSAPRAGLPSLPFPLTSSPRGVRALNPRPQGSVFVGLPKLAPELAATLQHPEPAPLAHAGHAKLARRAQQKLRMLSSVASLGVRLVDRGRPLVLVLLARGNARLHRAKQEASALGARLPGIALRARREASALGARLPVVAQRARTVVAQGARTALMKSGPKLAALRHWLELHGEHAGRQVFTRLSRLLSRPKPSVVRADPSRPIHS
jgi:hypothetical protein